MGLRILEGCSCPTPGLNHQQKALSMKVQPTLSINNEKENRIALVQRAANHVTEEHAPEKRVQKEMKL